MSAVAHDLIAAVHAAGGNLTVLDGRLKVEASAPLPADMVERLRARKAEVLALLIASAIVPDDDVERAAIIAEASGEKSRPRPLRLQDGRLFHSFLADTIPPEPSAWAASVLPAAKARHVVMVADGLELHITEPRPGTLPEESLDRLWRRAGDVIAGLRAEGRWRDGVTLPLADTLNHTTGKE